MLQITRKTPDKRLSDFNEKILNFNHLNPVDGSRKNRQSEVKRKVNHHNNPNQTSNISKKVMVIGNSIVKYLRLNELSSSD